MNALGSQPLRPYTTAVLAMTVDGKIADRARSPARFGSWRDRQHLETCLAEADGFLFGAGTLRSYGTSLPIKTPHLLQQRQARGQSAQPIHILCSQSGQFSPDLAFFSQPLTRWLVTTPTGAQAWTEGDRFERILIHEKNRQISHFAAIFQQLAQLNLQRLVIGGGGTLVAALLAEHLIDELWITLCPLLLGGKTSPTLVDGEGWPVAIAPRLELLSIKAVEQEVFLHYRVGR